MRIRSSSPPTLSLAPLPPTPAPSVTAPVSPVDPKREPTPFDELPMSHLISFPIMDSPTSVDPIDSGNPFESFHTLNNPYSNYQSSSALIRDAFDYYRLPGSHPSPITDALNMSMHGAALKPQLHAHALPDLTTSLYSAPVHTPQQQQQQQQHCIPTAHLFSSSAPTPAQPLKAHSEAPEDDGTTINFRCQTILSNPSEQGPPHHLVLHLLNPNHRKSGPRGLQFQRRILFRPMSAVSPSVKRASSKTAQLLSSAARESVKNSSAWKCGYLQYNLLTIPTYSCDP